MAQQTSDHLVLSALIDFNAHAHFPLPLLNAGQRRQLIEGRLVRIRQVSNEQEPRRVIGLRLLKQPREAIWLASLDSHFTGIEEFSGLRLSPEKRRPAIWYGYLRLPWPFRDRHWVVQTWDNHELARESRGLAWEHVWQLDEESLPDARTAIESDEMTNLDEASFERAVFTPVNHGAWIAIALEDGSTILGFHSTSTMGGAIPDPLVVRWSFWGLERLLGNVSKRAQEIVPQHYRGDHALIPGGDGRYLKLYPSDP